jgi:hypothetical protein
MKRSSLWQMFGDATLHNTVAPLLVLCYDLSTVASFLFSHANAAESSGLDFWLRDVFGATCRGAARSVDGPW